MTTRCASAGWPCATGCSCTGPRHWAAAVRADDGSIAVASGPKPRVRGGVGRIAGVRGVVRLGEAMAVIPLVKRALPQARLPFQDATVVVAMGATAAAGVALGGAPRDRRRGRPGRAVAGAVAHRPARWGAGRLPRGRAQGDRRLRAGRRRCPRRDQGARPLRLAPDGAAAGRQPGRHRSAAPRSSVRRRWPAPRSSSPRSAPRSRSSRGRTPRATALARALRGPGTSSSASWARASRPRAARGRPRRAGRDPARRSGALTLGAEAGEIRRDCRYTRRAW